MSEKCFEAFFCSSVGWNWKNGKKRVKINVFEKNEKSTIFTIFCMKNQKVVWMSAILSSMVTILHSMFILIVLNWFLILLWCYDFHILLKPAKMFQKNQNLLKIALQAKGKGGKMVYDTCKYTWVTILLENFKRVSLLI